MARTRLAIIAAIALIGLDGGLCASAQSANASLTDLGPGTRAYGINAAGQVTGCIAVGSGAMHAFLYSAGAFTDLGTLGGADSCGLALNASGEVTGYADTAAGRSAFSYQNGLMSDLSVLSGVATEAGLAINTAGDIVGYAPQSGVSGAFLYSQGVVTYLFPVSPDLTNSTATAINDNGVIAGYESGPCGILCPIFYPFTQVNGVTTSLPATATFDPEVTGINDSGQVIAWGEDAEGSFHGTLYDNGTAVDLGLKTTANGINSNGDVVGNSNVPRLGSPVDPAVGVYLLSGGVTTDLNLPGANPTGINDSGWIILNHTVLDHAYLLRSSSIGLAPTGLSFGEEPISVPSSQATAACGGCTATLTNSTGAALAVGSIAATAPYSVTHDCPVSLAAGASCTIAVVLTPATFGAQPGALTVVAGGAAYATLLQGSGIILMVLAPASAPATAGQPFTVSWEAGTGAKCTASGGNWDSGLDALPASGSQAISEGAAGSYTYTLICAYGSAPTQAKAQLTVAVQSAPSGTPGMGDGSGGSGSGGSGGGGAVDPWMLAALAGVLAARRRGGYCRLGYERPSLCVNSPPPAG